MSPPHLRRRPATAGPPRALHERADRWIAAGQLQPARRADAGEVSARGGAGEGDARVPGLVQRD